MKHYIYDDYIKWLSHLLLYIYIQQFIPVFKNILNINIIHTVLTIII